MQQTLNQAVQPAPAGTCATYERRRPEETVLYQLVREPATAPALLLVPTSL